MDWYKDFQALLSDTKDCSKEHEIYYERGKALKETNQCPKEERVHKFWGGFLSFSRKIG